MVALMLWGMAACAWCTLPPATLRLSVLDVGQGDSILIQTPLQQTILIDGGPAENVLPRLGQELPYFQHSIDLVVVTHPDSDHITGLVSVLQRYRVGGVLMTGVVHDSAVYAALLQEIHDIHVPVYIADSTQNFDFGDGVELDTLFPVESLAGENPKSTNATSIVARLRYGRTSAMLTGDAEFATEYALLRTTDNLKSEVLKLGHHGSKYSTGAAWVAAVQPEMSIVSAGAKNRYGHPTAEALDHVQDSKIYETEEVGTVHLVSDGTTWSVRERSTALPYHGE